LRGRSRSDKCAHEPGAAKMDRAWHSMGKNREVPSAPSDAYPNDRLAAMSLFRCRLRRTVVSSSFWLDPDSNRRLRPRRGRPSNPPAAGRAELPVAEPGRVMPPSDHCRSGVGGSE